VYLPPESGADRPGVLLIHGGGWRSFSKDVYVDHGIRLADAGFVVASINYRLVPDGAYPEMMKDCLCALAFFRANALEYGLDPDRVAVAGYSAGGHLASLIAVAAEQPEFQPDCDAGPTTAPNAVVAGAGPQDMHDLPQVDAVTEFLGGTSDDIPEIYDLASPMFHVRPLLPPFLFIHGDADVFVDIAHSERMRDALVAEGNSARLLSLHGGGHILNPSPDLGRQAGVITSADSPEAWAAMLAFLDRTVGAR
jgi:acetyl esterase/lipase